MSTLKINLRETLNAFSNYKNISWSKYNDFNSCPGNWFAKNYVKFIDVEAVAWESSKAIPGTIVQRLFESFINERVYKRVGMNTMQSLVDWFHTNTRALLNLIAFDYQTQFEMERQRYFFRRKEGKSRVAKMQKEYNLDPVFYKGIQPQFIDWDSFNIEEGGKETFIKKLNKLYHPILESWVEAEINLDKMLSEVWVKGTLFQDINIVGKVDFIYNKYQVSDLQFDTVALLQNAFIIIDGKFNISKWVKKEQLFFYAAALYMRYKRVPNYCIFYSWTKAVMETYKFKLSYLNKLKEKIISIITLSKQIGIFLTELQDKGKTTICLTDIPGIEFKAGQSSCYFCPIKKHCPAAIEKGLDKDNRVKGVETKRQTTALLKGQGIEFPDDKIHEIKI